MVLCNIIFLYVVYSISSFMQCKVSAEGCHSRSPLVNENSLSAVVLPSHGFRISLSVKLSVHNAAQKGYTENRQTKPSLPRLVSPQLLLIN